VFVLTTFRDNEKPVRQIHVHSFEAQGRPISNEEVIILVFEFRKSF